MKHMGTRFMIVVCLAAAGFAAAPAQPSIEKLFLDAGAKEQAVRTALADPNASETVLKAVRTVVGDYDAIVRRFPTSAYCDDALWRAGQLSLEAYGRFADAHDRLAAIRLLRTIVSQYPSSKFAKQAPSVIAAAEARAAARTEAARPKPPANSAAAVPVKTTGRSAAARLVTIKDIRRIVLPDAVRIVIELDGEVETFHDERLANPVRVFVDLSSTRAAPELIDRTIRFDGDGEVVRQVRLGRHPNATTRVVVDALGISSYSVYPLYSPYRLVIDFIKEPAGTIVSKPLTEIARPVEPAKPAVKPVVEAKPSPDLKRIIDARPPAVLQGRRIVSQVVTALYRPLPPRLPRPAESVVPKPLPSAAVRAPATITLAEMPRRATGIAAAAPASSVAALPSRPTPSVPVPATPATIGVPSIAAATTAATLPAERTTTTSSATTTTAPSTTTTAPARPNIAGGFSMARQLGLGVSRIVIDPGHGGHDPGGVVRGTTEAAIVLDVALRLEKLLAAVPGVEVILTRRTDEFLGLQDRTAIANREGADLFLSIHANANNNKSASGVETYFLNFAQNASAAAIAARENAGSGQAMGALPDFVKMIALSNKMDESRDFATMVQRAMVERLTPAHKGLKDLGVKQAPFVVLIGASMPSVLAEISFLTNAQEARLLRTTSYRQKIAEALFDAIRKYQTSLNTDAQVAQ
jgi:N-acetylmuramoyl-L-alanine amidase